MSNNLQLNSKRKLSVFLMAVLSSCIATFSAVLLVDDESSKEKRRRLRQNADTMRNLCFGNSHPQYPLVLRDIIGDVFTDHGRDYCRVLTHFYDWEFFALTDYLAPYLRLPRNTTDEMIREVGIQNIPIKPCKPNLHQRLFYSLQWLVTGKPFRVAQFDTGWAKTSLNDDLRHVLKSVIRGLNHFVQWPDEEKRHRIANETNGIMKGCIGIMDCSEHIVQRPVDKFREQNRYSGKAKAHTLKTMAVIDNLGYFTYVVTGIEGTVSDREILTQSPLYMDRGEYFSEGEWMGTDGAFQGDGPVVYSYKDMQGDYYKQLFNSAFKERRMTIENAFGRVQSWFPILGNAKAKFDCDDDLMYLSVHASVRLHNWLLHNRNCNYNVDTSGNALFSVHY